ncbi:unnamed protein product [Prunus armeniaca]|uniref:Uncharacterized protein n=1 Tax=Prunus armeniaca TaxID=36596 RepID=A0A6J5WHY8_PRUAR|nr:unnamed protein product [Prunus armeniaca]
MELGGLKKEGGAAGTKRKNKHIRRFWAIVTSIIINKVRNLSMARLRSKTSKDAFNIQYNQLGVQEKSRWVHKSCQ